MYQELHETRKEGKDREWIRKGLVSLLDPPTAAKLYDQLIQDGEVTEREEEEGSHPITSSTSKQLEKLHENLRNHLRLSLQPLGRTPSSLLFLKQRAVWRRVVMATQEFYSDDNLKVALSKLSEDEEEKGREGVNDKESKGGESVKTSDTVLMETGVRTGLTLLFSLLRQVWDQSSWQHKLYLSLSQAGMIGK